MPARLGRAICKIKITPVEELEGLDGDLRNTIATEVGKKFSSKNYFEDLNIAVTAVISGYENKEPTYMEAEDSEVQLSQIFDSPLFLIKNTGRKYESSSKLGDESNYNVNIYVGSTLITSAGPGETYWYSGNPTQFTIKSVESDGSPITGVGNAVSYLIFVRYPTFYMLYLTDEDGNYLLTEDGQYIIAE